MLSAAGGAIVNFGRDAARGGQRLLELRHLLQRLEVILGPGQDEHIALDPLCDTSERVLLQLCNRFEWCLVPSVHMPLLRAQAKPGDRVALA